MSCRATSSINRSLAADVLAVVGEAATTRNLITAVLAGACLIMRGLRVLQRLLLRRSCHREQGSRTAYWG